MIEFLNSFATFVAVSAITKVKGHAFVPITADQLLLNE